MGLLLTTSQRATAATRTRGLGPEDSHAHHRLRDRTAGHDKHWNHRTRCSRQIYRRQGHFWRADRPI